jgi:hypothetical protein
VAGAVVVGGNVPTLSMVVPTASSGYVTDPLPGVWGTRVSVTPSTLERPCDSTGAWYAVAVAAALAVPAPPPAESEPWFPLMGGMPMVGNDRNVGGCSCNTESCWLETA